MIVRTWSGSYVELNRRLVLPWLLGWIRFLFRRRRSGIFFEVEQMSKPTDDPIEDPTRFRWPWEPMSRSEKLAAARAMLERVKPGRFRQWAERMIERLETLQP